MKKKSNFAPSSPWRRKQTVHKGDRKCPIIVSERLIAKFPPNGPESRGKRVHSSRGGSGGTGMFCEGRNGTLKVKKKTFKFRNKSFQSRLFECVIKLALEKKLMCKCTFSCLSLTIQSEILPYIAQVF